MNKKVQALWAKSELKVWEASYWFVAFDFAEKTSVFRMLEHTTEAESYTSCIFDNHEISVLLPEGQWLAQRNNIVFRQEFGPLTCITFDIPLDIEVAGYLQPAITRLAEAGISVIPQCALIYDHIFVSVKDAENTVDILKQLQKDAQIQ